MNPLSTMYKGKEVIINESEDETSSETESEDDEEDITITTEDDGDGHVLVVDNIPKSTTQEEMEALFEPYGATQVKMHDKDETDHVCWYVTCSSLVNAEQAISCLHFNHTWPGEHKPITVVLKKKRVAKVPLRVCLKKLKKFTMSFNEDEEDNVVDQEKMCESMRMAIGVGGADSLISLFKQVAKDRTDGEHESSSPNDFELRKYSRDTIADLIMKPLDGKNIKKWK